MDLEEEENGVGRRPEKDLGLIREVGKESRFQDRDLLFQIGVETSNVRKSRSREVDHLTRIESTKVEEDQGIAIRAMISSEEVIRYRDPNLGESAVVPDVIDQSHVEV